MARCLSARMGLIVLFALSLGLVTGCTGAPPTATRQPFVFPATWTPVPTATPGPTATLVLGGVTLPPPLTLQPPQLPRPPLDKTPGPAKIAFISERSGEGAIYVMDPDGSNLKRVTNSQDEEAWPAWSPDGKALAFGAVTAEGSDTIRRAKIYTINADGTERRMLIGGPGSELFPAWSPEGTRIVFTAGDKIETVLTDGSQRQTLVKSGDSNLRNPHWSPDGSALVFASETLPAVARVRSEPIVKAIYIANADGSNIRFLAYGEMPAWSPDGRQIAFDAETGDNAQIFVINVDGSGLIQLTQGPERNIGPDWSPDGSRIAFASARDGNWEIYVMNADGTNQKRITNHRSMDWYPTWLR